MSDSLIRWAIIENIATLLVAVGGSIGLFVYTGPAHAFWLMLLLGNMNSFERRKGRSEGEG